jgi:hypothetical protein
LDGCEGNLGDEVDDWEDDSGTKLMYCALNAVFYDAESLMAAKSPLSRLLTLQNSRTYALHEDSGSLFEVSQEVAAYLKKVAPNIQFVNVVPEKQVAVPPKKPSPKPTIAPAKAKPALPPPLSLAFPQGAAPAARAGALSPVRNPRSPTNAKQVSPLFCLLISHT